MNASFFDIFGAIGFIFIVILSYLQIKSKKVLPKWIYYVLLVVGLIGLIVDLNSVYYYLFG